MTFDRIKEHNRIALLRVLGLLFAAVGLVRGGTVAVLPRHVRLSVLRLLRPLESATLRLVIVAARGMTVPVPSTRRGDAARAKKSRKSGGGHRAFPLVERLPRNAAPKPRYVPGPGPRLSFFDGSDPVIETPPAPSPDDPVDAARLCRRLLAVQMVLEDLSKHAKRLARWQARRDADQARGRTRPIRPGRPPGFRARALHEVDDILKECHDLALRALVPPDSS